MILIVSDKTLERKFGSNRQNWLIRKANGIDNSLISRDRQRKSIGHERTYLDDVTDASVIKESLLKLVRQGLLRTKEKVLWQKSEFKGKIPRL